MLMKDLNAAVDAAVRAESEDAGQITLGKLISDLSACKPDAYIMFAFGGISPGRLRSFRGYYDHLAIEPNSQYNVVGEFLDHCREVPGSTMSGYKGGDYVMDDDTPIWVARWGDSSNTRVVGVRDDDWRVVLTTVETDN